MGEVFAYFSMNEKEYLDFLDDSEGENLKAKLARLPEVQLELANGSLFEEKGKIEAVTGQIDPQTGSISFRASFPNKNKFLSNGNSGVIKVPKVYESVLVVPESATFEQQGVVSVYKVQADTVVANVVELIDRVDNLAVFRSKRLQQGDTVVALGINGLKTGTKIKTKPANLDSIVGSIKPIF